MIMRAHQAAMVEACRGIVGGSGITKIIINATPGSGKSCIPMIAAGSLIPAGLADALCWVVPRSALQDQGERNFLDPFFRDMFGHRLVIRSSTNDVNPCRGTNGFVTTYQALVADVHRSVDREFSRKRFILVLDEFHHVLDGGLWHKAIARLVEKATYLVLMTGTMARGDMRRIGLLEYEESGEGTLVPSFSGNGCEVIG